MKSSTYTGLTQLIHAPMDAGNLSEHGNNFNTFLFLILGRFLLAPDPTVMFTVTICYLHKMKECV